MGGLLIGLAFLMAALAAASRAHAATAAPAPAPGVDASVQKILRTGDPHKILAASQAAKESGNRHLADHLTIKAADANVMAPNAVFPSPFPSVPTAAWTKFVHLLRGKNPAEITAAYHLGLFAFGMPRLVDLGLASNPHQIQRNGRKVWDADWTPPASLEQFLASPSFQYHTFVKAMTADLHEILAKLPTAVGTEIDGQPATPSGLLAVVKQAGLKGLETWIADEATRKKFPTTTAQFHKLNGIF
jgi:hypothetical protein